MKKFFTKADKKNSNLYEIETNFWQKNQLICGVDEVGRGCLAGPVVTASIILSPYAMHEAVQDSKLLNSIQLENIFQWIVKHSWYAIGISNNRIIDQKNIYATTKLTMKKSLFHLFSSTKIVPSAIFIDAIPLSLAGSCYSNIAIESLIKGESKSASIAAASIIAKVTRDRIIKTMHQSFPSYGLDAHKGYGTKKHIENLQTYQPCIVHRKTFIKNFTQGPTHDQSNQKNLFC